MAGQIVAKDCTVLVGGYNFSNDLNTCTVGRTTEVPERTGFGETTRTRKDGGIKDWSITFAGFFNDNTGAMENRIQSLLAGSAVVAVFPHGITTACEIGYQGEAVEPNMGIESPVEGMVTANAEWSGSGDLHRGYILVPESASAIIATGSHAAPSRDFGGSAANVSAAIHITDGSSSESTDTMSFILQHSADDSAWSDLITFTLVSASGTSGCLAEVKTGTNGSRYMRFKWIQTGEEWSLAFVGAAGQD